MENPEPGKGFRITGDFRGWPLTARRKATIEAIEWIVGQYHAVVNEIEMRQYRDMWE